MPFWQSLCYWGFQRKCLLPNYVRMYYVPYYVATGRYLTCLVRNLLLASKFAYAGVQGYEIIMITFLKVLNHNSIMKIHKYVKPSCSNEMIFFKLRFSCLSSYQLAVARRMKMKEKTQIGTW